MYCLLLFWGRRQASFLRNHKRWQPLIPLLIDHVLVEIDLDADDFYVGANLALSSAGSRTSAIMGPITIESKLRLLSVKLLYEVCRVQKLSEQDLRGSPLFFLVCPTDSHDQGVFNDSFIDHLLELVEQTRFLRDETFNYSVIKFIVSIMNWCSCTY